MPWYKIECGDAEMIIAAINDIDALLVAAIRRSSFTVEKNREANLVIVKRSFTPPHTSGPGTQPPHGLLYCGHKEAFAKAMTLG